MQRPTLEIAGAGPAGLAAALTAARDGARVVVHERAKTPGSRFHGDFQGLESWTTTGDVLDELAEIGIEPTFDPVPVRRQVVWEPGGTEHVYESERPFFYLVRRGPQEGTLDRALADQAEAAGVEIRWGRPVRNLERGGIVATGPRGADAVAVGYVFDTDLADGCWAALGEDVAPGGYAYLLAHGGRATLATCIFHRFHGESQYLERAFSFFRERLGFSMAGARTFGGAGNFRLPATAVRGDLLLAGEAAGFQDPLWGFGMRYAMLSGHLAAQAWLRGSPEIYDRLWQERLGGPMRAGTVNRFLYERLGDFGRRLLARGLAGAADPRAWLRRRYLPTASKRLLFHLVRHAVLQPAEDPATCFDRGCDCTWCRCQRHALSGHRSATKAVADCAPRALLQAPAGSSGDEP